MDQLRIWEADCSLMDAVLALSFDPQELLNCCQSGGVSVGPCTCRAPAHAVIGAAHRGCHEDTPFARLIERRLNLVHRRALAALATQGLDALGGELLGRDLSEVPDLPGALWALSCCPRPEAELLRAHVRARLILSGAAAVAAGGERATSFEGRA